MGSEMRKIGRAIISVSDKRGILDLARTLKGFGVEILSTGGTMAYLSKNGIEVKGVSEHTGFPEILGGRVKTLHPRIHGGILAKRKEAIHLRDLEETGIEAIDMVVVNLYPFEETVARGCTLEEAIEEIDIGGPSMIRAAAKNYRDVAVVVDPDDYGVIIEELQSNDGALSLKTRFNLARKVFALTARYDYAIYSYLSRVDGKEEAFPEDLLLYLSKVQDLRYGENPHQKAALYRWGKGWVSGARKLQGKELSYNNILDLDSAYHIAREFEEPSVVVVKHNNPCGVAVAPTLKEAYEKALSCDPVSAFGGIVATNRTIDRGTAEAMVELFLEVIVAPGFDKEALDVLGRKKNLRLIEAPEVEGDDYEIRSVEGGLLLQGKDRFTVKSEDLRVVTGRKPSEKEVEDLLFAWRVCKHVKSNAIVFARGGQTLGIGAGQMSRVDSVRLGIMKAKKAGLNLEGAVMASDGFFPFRDSIDIAAREGIRAVIQPGGSVRDEEVIKAAEEHSMSLVLTGVRHFRH